MNKTFEQIAKENFETVKTWPKWKQKIVINSNTIATGQYNMSEREWEKTYEER
jgi:hypothetical protein